MNAFVPCHSSTPKSTSKPSVIVYQGIVQPIRAFIRSISCCGARETKVRVVSRACRWATSATWSATREPAAAGMVGPAEHAGLEERAVDDQLTATFEQVEQAHPAVRPVEQIVLDDR